MLRIQPVVLRPETIGAARARPSPRQRAVTGSLVKRLSPHGALHVVHLRATLGRMPAEGNPFAGHVKLRKGDAWL